MIAFSRLPESRSGVQTALLTEAKVATGKAFQNARDDKQVYKQFVENDSFRRFVGDMVYQLSSQAPMTSAP